MRISLLLETKGTDVSTIVPTATVSQAVTELGRRGIGALVVSSDGSTIEGIVSERDIVRRMASGADGVLGELVSSIMSSSVHTCGPEDEVESIMTIMTEHRIRHVPVVRDGRLAGLVSIGDVVKSRIDELERDRRELVEYITAR